MTVPDPAAGALHSRRSCQVEDCVTCRRIGRATIALITNPRGVGCSKQYADPVLWADAQTSYHDFRAAICFAQGATIDQVHPVTGHYLGGSA